MQQSNASQFNLLNLGGGAEFKQIVQSILSAINTGELVEVTAVDASGDSPVGFVSVKILVQRANADGTNVELGEIHNVPYFRLQGGINAVIMDPVKGDIGYCGFCSRDISIVKRIRDIAPQGNYRVSDIADAVFFGGWSSKAPEQYIWFDGDDVKIKAKATVVIDAPLTHCKGNLIADGTIKDLAQGSGLTMDSMRTTYNSHTHLEQGDGQQTGTPSAPMG